MNQNSVQTPPPIRRVVIVGGGTAGWMAAAALARTLPKTIQIRLIESDAIGTVGVGEATLPNMTTFNRMLGIDEREVMAQTQATFKLGIEFIDWGKKGERYIHPFGPHGVDMDGISFHQYWMKLRQAGHGAPIEEYSMSAVSARHDKFALPVSDPRSALSRLSYAYQFNATQYAGFLRQYSEARGVIRREGKVVNVTLGSENGFIQSVTLESGAMIEGDLFIDCSGFRALLIGDALKTPYEDWSRWLPCNSALTVQSGKTGPTRPYTKSTAKSAGWQWEIPLQTRMGNGYVYCSNYISDEDAERSLRDTIDGPLINDVRQLRFTTGKRSAFWVKNCIALGLSGGFLEPLESTSIYLIQAGITKLLSLFPDTDCAPIQAQEYNRILNLEFEQIRDFLMLHYVANQREGDKFWDEMRNALQPDSLKNKIALFKHRGAFFRYDGDLFTETSWIAVLLGQNIIPNGYSALVESASHDQLKESLDSMHNGLLKAAKNLPSHDAFLAKYCPANPHPV